MQSILTISVKVVFHVIAHFIMIIQLNSCFLKQDRTTTVYGTITDQNGEPVDSIMVIARGKRGFSFETLKQTYTNGEGCYEILIDPPKKFDFIDISVPFLLIENPKFFKYYTGKKTRKDDEKTSNCCIAPIGEKTKYDFQLIPK
ncbi:carboxypeptidase-like regulatory domain-containing protein [Dyadobacter fanqingshengii]|uniref:Carboxypeptidase-like regulatory domain-containing protein n=1 Tax=Dyadobacter fanqingshengii TaxID=2906443 RepID=A0A9X1P5X2_9BACT|nr:carboxypeptidase-like regulatory domain-containing protein [Dyadobacter fanqingshengii]MCF0038515.1 carboxypeptidase-like regulatory domain-containing protein [Dyadobacter fanqingshengii]USJ34652.1 carboxypeptidase-like regulatory domain-containing protein [Dyadobacter fanqingshengii]